MIIMMIMMAIMVIMVKVVPPHLDPITVDRHLEDEGEDHTLRLHLDHHLIIIVIAITTITPPHIHHRGIVVEDYPLFPDEDLLQKMVSDQVLVAIVMAVIEVVELYQHHHHHIMISLVRPVLR